MMAWLLLYEYIPERLDYYKGSVSPSPKVQSFYEAFGLIGRFKPDRIILSINWRDGLCFSAFAIF